jgi:hypothetical protein
MAVFSKHRIGIADLIRELPEETLARLSAETQVDHYSKVLSGKLMFGLLLYGMLRIDRLSQRGLRDAFSSPIFRTLFRYQGKKEIAHSSISERLNGISVDFFKGAYECLYARFSSLYTQNEIAGMYLQRVDSTLIKETCNKLKKGLTCGNEYGKTKMLKYTLNYDGMFGDFCKVHHEASYASECKALPENVLEHFKKNKNHATVYLFDRGQSSAEAFKEMQGQDGLLFVGRLNENRKLKPVQAFDVTHVPFTQGTLLEDGLYQLYKTEPKISKTGKESRASVLVATAFRVIRFQAEGKQEPVLLITNCETMSADEIAQMYRRRWDIEVFFRFLKQELNFSHFLSLHDNGIQVILYMTLITAMLVMIYKKENELGFKTAVRRMGIELESWVIATIVLQSGGDLRKTDLPAP